jgi:hypothetical protein
VADLRNLAAALKRSEADKWFPASYSDDPATRLRQRQEACKAFIFGPIRTTDAQERVLDPRKQIPRMPYLETMVDALVAEPDLLIPKMRRMIQTLTCEAYLVWRILERPGTWIAVVHATLEDGIRHVEEDIKDVMWASLPQFLTAPFTLGATKGQLRLTLRGNPKTGINDIHDSWIIPYPTGAKQLRSFGHAVIFWDEFSTHPGAKQASKGILPTLIGRTQERGQLIRMGTVNPDTASGRYFKELYEPQNFRRARSVARYGAEIGELER